MEILLENFSCYLERATIGGSSLYSRGTEADEGTGGRRLPGLARR